jgi:aryl-alcohol dehydrogenase-like predicted oxidoreductase
MGSVLPDALESGAARARAFAFLDGLLEMGCTAFDMAASYMLGGTERLFGAWMASRRNRDLLYLVSKGGHPYPVVGRHRLGRRALSADLDGSLRRLRVERIDLYLLHKDDDMEPLESILETMTAFTSSGKIVGWGVSNWTHARIRAMAAIAKGAGVAGASASSPHFSLVRWTQPPWPGSVSIAGEEGADGRAYHEETQLPVLAWSPLGGGFFGSGRHAAPYANAANEERRRRAEALGAKRAASAAQVALAYLLHQPFPVFAVVAARTADHMKRNVDATAIRLSPGELRWLEGGEGVSPA